MSLTHRVPLIANQEVKKIELLFVLKSQLLHCLRLMFLADATGLKLHTQRIQRDNALTMKRQNRYR